MTDPVKFWKDDPMVLLDVNKLKEFVPKENMSFNQKSNAMARFVIYFSIMVFLFYGSSESLLLLVVGLGLIYFLHEYRIDIAPRSTSTASTTSTASNASTTASKSSGFAQSSVPSNKIKHTDRGGRIDRTNSNSDTFRSPHTADASIEGFTDSLLPSGMFDQETEKKFAVKDINIKYSDVDNTANANEKSDQNTTRANLIRSSDGATGEIKGLDGLEGSCDRSGIVPGSVALASVDSVRDAFKKPDTFGSALSITSNPVARENETGAISGTEYGRRKDCMKCSPVSFTKYM